jgi:glycosyltransferase involved in cell wall biosynthesis
LSAFPNDVDEIVLVDGGSIDGTVEAAREVRSDLVVVRQARRGKGNALAAGFAAATGHFIVMLDADCSMDPGEIPSFVGALRAGADYAKGSRFAAGGGSEDITVVRRLGNWMLNRFTNVLFGTRYSDLCYGYNAFRRECLEAFALEPAHESGPPRWGDGFEIETILNTRVARAKLRVVEVSSFERNRLYGASALRTFRDGGRVLATILRERLRAAPDMDRQRTQIGRVDRLARAAELARRRSRPTPGDAIDLVA